MTLRHQPIQRGTMDYLQTDNTNETLDSGHSTLCDLRFSSYSGKTAGSASSQLQSQI